MRGKGRRASKSSVMVNQHLGQRLRGRRVLLGLSQAQLARNLGVTFQQIQKYENGGSQLTPERLHCLAVSLGVAVDFFFDGLPELRGADKSSKEALLPDGQAQDAQILALVRSYGRIADDAKRRSFLHLVQSVSNSDLAGSPS